MNQTKRNHFYVLLESPFASVLTQAYLVSLVKGGRDKPQVQVLTVHNALNVTGSVTALRPAMTRRVTGHEFIVRRVERIQSNESTRGPPKLVQHFC
jgi:hypothetical protein